MIGFDFLVNDWDRDSTRNARFFLSDQNDEGTGGEGADFFADGLLLGPTPRFNPSPGDASWLPWKQVFPGMVLLPTGTEPHRVRDPAKGMIRFLFIPLLLAAFQIEAAGFSSEKQTSRSLKQDSIVAVQDSVERQGA